jgi:hypothetical protein
MGSTINWSAQVKELNLSALPFMFPSYQAVDAVQAGEPGKRLFKFIEQKGVVPIDWGETGFRELTNAKRPVRKPVNLQGLKIRVVGIPIFVDTFRALRANPVSMDWNSQALPALPRGTVASTSRIAPSCGKSARRSWRSRKGKRWRDSRAPLVSSRSSRRLTAFERRRAAHARRRAAWRTAMTLIESLISARSTMRTTSAKGNSRRSMNSVGSGGRETDRKSRAR